MDVERLNQKSNQKKKRKKANQNSNKCRVGTATHILLY